MPGLLEEVSNNNKTKETTSQTSTASPGVVLGKDGKPCRTCTSSTAWLNMMKSSTKKNPSPSTSSSTTGAARAGIGALALVPSAAAAAAAAAEPSECPPDVEELGRSTWTLLHSLTATYPEQPSASMQSMTKQFIQLFSQLYPCWVCADDFRSWLAKPENHVDAELQSQERFGRWMCRAHNEVNRKLGKKEFDCNLWRQRWKDGWADGRCD